MADNQMKSNGNAVISLEELLREIAPQGLDGALPPVDTWNPERCSDIDMRIRADGSWWHEGEKIQREKLVKLFSRILRRDEDGQTYLVTPYEKVIVEVEDAPFLAVRVDRVGESGPDQILAFTTNVGDLTVAGPKAEIRVEIDPHTSEPSPYIHVRGRLEAKLTRPAFYELVELAEPSKKDPTRLIVWSQGKAFDLGYAGE
ncbi:MAG: DUF1285 domain-containing protein [Pseudomonadota bacterium]